MIARRIVSLSLFLALLSPVAATVAASPVESSATVCPTYDLSTMFYDDWFPGTKWDNSSGARVIRWAPVASGALAGDTVARPFSAAELDVVRSAFASFDAALDTISFQEVALDQAEITIGWVNLSVAGVDGYWNAWWDGARIRYRATIRLAAASGFLARSAATLRHGVQHELGNALGLGDIRPNESFASVQEDPWQAPYGPVVLSEFDRGIVRQLYGESTCYEATPVVLRRITCTKGTRKRVITAEKPRCPAGWKRVGKPVVVGA